MAGRVLPVCYLPYITLRKRKKKDSQGGYHYRRCLAETDFLKHSQTRLTDSPFLNQPFVAENLGTLIACNMLGDLDYTFLRNLCQDLLRIRVFEIPMAEHGRLVVRPKWRPAQGGYTINDFSVAVAINRQLTQTQKLLALGHELGHYVFHMPSYVFSSGYKRGCNSRPGWKPLPLPGSRPRGNGATTPQPSSERI